MSTLRIFFVLAFFGLMLQGPPTWAQAASPVVCWTDADASAGRSAAVGFVSEFETAAFASPLFGGFQCRDLSRVGVGLQAISMALSAGGIYAACTGVGAPVTVVLQSGALGLSAINLVVSHLPCEDAENDQKVKAAAQSAVCEALEKSGIKCVM